MITHPDKKLFPDLTKQDLVDYYRAVPILRHLKGRPLILHRFPNGIRKPGFFEHNRHCSTRTELVTLVNLNTIEFHRCQGEKKPENIVFDLDAPDFSAAVDAAKLLRELLGRMRSFVMTTGGKGLHVVVPIRRGPTYEEVRAWARDLVSEEPDFTLEQRKNRRRGRVFVDVARNSGGMGTIAPYSLRARPGAPVATPVSWDELRKNLRFDLKKVLRRKGDPWARIAQSRSSSASF